VNEHVAREDALHLDLDRYPEHNCSMGGLFFLEGAPSVSQLGETLRDLVDAAPRMGCVVTRDRAGRRVWADRSRLLVRDALEVIDLEDATASGLMRSIAERYGRSWDPTARLWDCTLFRDPSEDACVFIRIHHALGDGQYFLQSLMNARPPAMTRAYKGNDVLRKGISPGWVQTVSELNTYCRSMARALRGGQRTIGAPSTARSIGLRWTYVDAWKKAARDRKGSINALFVSMAATALYRYFREVHDLHLPRIHVAMPIDLRMGTQRPGNHAAETLLQLRVGPRVVDDLRDVVQLVKKSLRPSGMPIGPSAARVHRVLPNPLRTTLTRRFWRLYDGICTNLRYPLAAMTFAGKPVRALFAVAPAIATPATFSLLRYAGALYMAMTIDPGQVPKPERFFTVVNEVMADVFGQAHVHHP
jgi:WS/DGAT C-terminal domain